jgi:hypothetical protein
MLALLERGPKCEAAVALLVFISSRQLVTNSLWHIHPASAIGYTASKVRPRTMTNLKTVL